MSDPVLDLLNSKGISYQISGKDYLTKCLNPDHTDTNPSFRIDRATGICHCFSCGFKANIFKHFGILTNSVSIKVVRLKEKLRTLKEAADGLDPIEGAKLVSESFRGVSVKTLKEFEAFTTTYDQDFIDRIVFPVKDVRGKVSAYIGRHTLSNASPRYMIKPTGAVVNMYPIKLPDHPKSIVLVEGIFDLLNLWDRGMRNVVCTFGTTKLYTDAAAKLLPYKVMGVEKIFILFDGDDPGKVAAEKTKPLIEDCGFTVEIINLPDDTDPGELDQEYVDSIREYTK